MSRSVYWTKSKNQITPFWIQVMFSVFRGPKYDDIRPKNNQKPMLKNHVYLWTGQVIF